MLPSPLAFAARIKRNLRDRFNNRAWRAALAAWRAEHPAGDYAQFYAWYARERLRSGRHLPQTLGSDINQRFQRGRALAMRHCWSSSACGRSTPYSTMAAARSGSARP